MDSKPPISDPINPPDQPTANAIETNLAAGARAFALKNYGDAADCFSMALEALSVHYGSDRHPALVDAQILYGKALLRNGVRLAAVLGGKAETETGGPSEEKEEKTSAINRPGPSGSSSAAPGKSVSGNVNHPHIHFSGDKSSDDEGSDEEDGDGDADEDEDAEQGGCTADGELDSAFQILELARLSLEVQVTNVVGEDRWKVQNKLIQVLELLSEVHQELEVFPPALESYLKSLEIKKSLPSEVCSARSIAETHLYVALAYELVTDEPNAMDKAMKHVEEAIGLLHTHISGLEASPVPDESKNLSNGDERSKSDLKPKEEAEECRAILRDLEAKLEELKTVPRPASPTAVELAYKAYLANAIIPGAKPGEKSTVNDLSGLVKKKEKQQPSGSGTLPEPSKRALESEESDGGQSKRSKVDEVENLDS